ncbi:DUF4934 domain-containing protein [Roseivirga echinicomitans]
MNLLKKLGYFFFILFIISCKKKENIVSLPTINIEGAFFKPNNKNKGINSTDIFSNIKYVKLETTPKTLYNFEPKVYTYKEFLVIKAHKRISLFSRTTGEYLQEIGHFGNDPDGFSSSLPFFGINEEKGTVYAQGWRFNLLEYSIINGKAIGEIMNPLEDSPYEGVITSYGVISEDTLIGFLTNYSGREKVKLLIFNENGEVISEIFNNQFYIDDPNKFSFDPLEGEFFKWNNELQFKETFNDTVFTISDNVFKPRFYFNLGGYSPDYSQKENVNRFENDSYMFISDISETDQILFFSITYLNKKYACAFFKIESILMVSNDSGFSNDIDGFVPFYPNYINDQGEVVSVISAEVIYEWFQKNPDKIKSLPKHLQNLQNIDPEDNPVVMIAKLK